MCTDKYYDPVSVIYMYMPTCNMGSVLILTSDL